MKGFLRIGVCGLLCLLFGGGASRASPLPFAEDVEVQYYPVTGISLKALRESLRSAGPRDDAGGARIARTDWDIRWRWELLADGSPDIHRIETTLKLQVLLPRWQDEFKAPPAVRREWLRYMRAVVSHEWGHVAIAQEGYRRLRSVLDAAEGAQTADSLNKLARGVLAGMHRDDHEFDKATKHGMLTGVILVENAGQ